MNSVNKPVCGRCGRVHEKCKGHKAAKRGGGPCEANPMRNQQVCKNHGGRAPQNLAAAARRGARQALEETVAVYGLPRHIDPADGLIEEYWRTAGIVLALERIVAAIPKEELVFGVAEIREGLDPPTGEDGTGSAVAAVTVKKAAPNVWVRMFAEERDRWTKLGVEIVRLGLEARRDEYVRAQVEVFAGVLQAPELGLSPEQLGVAARLLRALGAQPGAEPLMLEASAEEMTDGH